METKRPLSVYLRPSLIERIEAAAKADTRSVSNYIEAVLEAVTPLELGQRVIIPSTPADYRVTIGNASESAPMSQEARARQATNRR
jgi:hypothetical protein